MPYASWSVIAGEQPTAAKWNILGTNDAFFDTEITALKALVGIDTDGHTEVKTTSNKLVKVALLRQDNTTNSYKPRSVILTGWGFIQNDGSSATTKAVTFGITFNASPIVIVSLCGERDATNPTVIGDLNTTPIQDGVDATAAGYAISTTGFTAVYRRSTADASMREGYAWVAIGELD